MTRIAIVSDLHAQSGSVDTSRSHLSVGTAGDGRSNPLDALRIHVVAEGVTADVLVCCGDLGDRADQAGITYAWDGLEQLRDALGAKSLLATCGNHDIDSRYATHDYDPIAHVKSLEPRFPVDSEIEFLRYWAKHFGIVDVADCRFVLLNTSAYHQKPEEVEHGRVADRTVDEIRAELARRPSASINVLVCHHHPYRYGKVDVGDYGEVRGFGYLNEMMGSGEFGKWLVVHGHRHWPWLSYGYGGATAPTVFSAGSLSASVWDVLKPAATNQFYVVEVDETASEDPSMGVAGTFESWDWNVSHGWTQSASESAIPAEGGFGYKKHLVSAMHDLRDHLRASGEPYLLWREVLDSVPSLRFLLPDDRRAVRALFAAAGGKWEPGPTPNSDQLGTNV